MSDLTFVIPQGIDPLSRQLRSLIRLLQESHPCGEVLHAQARVCGRVAAALRESPEELDRLLDAVIIPLSAEGIRLLRCVHDDVGFGYRARS